jgi:hypothetical protein
MPTATPFVGAAMAFELDVDDAEALVGCDTVLVDDLVPLNVVVNDDETEVEPLTDDYTSYY